MRDEDAAFWARAENDDERQCREAAARGDPAAQRVLERCYGAAPPQPPLSEAMQRVISCASSMTVAASVADHCRYPEATLRGDVVDLRDACAAYLADHPA